MEYPPGGCLCSLSGSPGFPSETSRHPLGQWPQDRSRDGSRNGSREDGHRFCTSFALVLHYGTHLQRATHYPLSPAADLVPRRIAAETRSPPILAPVVGPLHRGPGHSVSVVGSSRASRRGSQSGSGSARSARRLGQPGNPAPGDGGETRGCARDAGDGTGDRASDRPPQCCLFYLWG